MEQRKSLAAKVLFEMPCFNYLGLFNWTTIVKLSFVELALFCRNEQYYLSRQRKRLIQINDLIYIFLIKLLFNITTHSFNNERFLFEYLLITHYMKELFTKRIDLGFKYFFTFSNTTWYLRLNLVLNFLITCLRGKNIRAYVKLELLT